MDSYSIYPKQFRNAKIPIEKNRVFILMPFNDEFDSTYGHIKKALNNNGYVCYRSDEIIGNKPIMNKILNEILKSHYIIADLSTQNANVFYELGITHTFKDAQNIVLITQDINEIPFDIRHINSITYDPGNMKYLTSQILKLLEANKYLLGFYEALQRRSIIRLINDNKEEFVDYLRINLGNHVPLATDILADDLPDQREEQIQDFLQHILNIIDITSKSNNYLFLTGIFKFLFECLLTCSRYKITDQIVNDLLNGNLMLSYNLNEGDRLSLQSDLAILLSTYGSKLNLAMDWIIGYFARTKSATIDLNRYKIERFLMTSNDVSINEIMINALYNNTCYIREHLADIIGEKRLLDAGKTLITQLQIEDNYFTAVSFISAIGKLEVSDGADAINRWLNLKKDDIITTKQFFVFKHCYIAFNRIDQKYGTEHLQKFQQVYDVYIKDYFIL